MPLSRRAFLLGQRATAEPVVAVPVRQVATIMEHCLALQSVVCRTCGEACEAGAIRFQLRPGGVAQPLLEIERCTGCGDCLPDCPTQAMQLIAAPSEFSSPALQGAS